MSDLGVVALDFDGTIVDSMPGLRRLAGQIIGEETGRTNGIIDRYNMTTGYPFRVQLDSILPDKEGFTPTVRDHLAELYEKEKIDVTLKAEPFDDVVRSLPGLVNAEYSLVVVSSTKNDLIIDRLKALDIWKYFDACLGEEAGRWKRNKLRYARAKWFVGDSDSDLREADAAGCYFFGVCRDRHILQTEATFSETFVPVTARLLEIAHER